MSEKTATLLKYAPHAVLSGVGLEEERLVPEDRSAATAGIDSMEGHNDEKDHDLRGHVRGQDKIGGTLAPIQPQGLPTSARKPILVTPGNNLDFVKYRKKKTIGQRLAEITELRDKIRLEKLALENATVSNTNTSPMSLRRMSRSGSTFNENSYPGNRSSNNMLRSRSSRDDFAKRKSSRNISDDINNNSNHNSAAIQALEPPTEYDTEFKQLKKEMSSLTKDEKKTAELKDSQRVSNNSLRAKEIERKRRLLRKQQGKKKGAMAEDPFNIYDYQAIKVQAAARGWLARAWVKWYREAVVKASRVLQAVGRGFNARQRVRKMLRVASGATKIQSAYRGYRARVSRAYCMLLLTALLLRSSLFKIFNIAIYN